MTDPQQLPTQVSPTPRLGPIVEATGACTPDGTTQPPRGSIMGSSGPLPTHLGRYTVIKEIAHGGMGIILLGYDPQLQRELALKLLLVPQNNRPQFIERFVTEARITGQLQHPGVVPIHEMGAAADGRPYFVMKLVMGRTLAQLLAERSNPAQDRPRYLKVFEQICQTMAYVHSQGVIHRDLKPLNIMVGAFGEVQVMDWGLAKQLSVEKERQPSAAEADSKGNLSPIDSHFPSSSSAQTQLGAILGTPAYMPPEQARGEIDRLGPTADVFGLGAILCEILTGRPPYRAPSSIEILEHAVDAKLTSAFAALDQCGADRELVQLAKECLSAAPENRPIDGGAVADAVTAYQTGVRERLKTAELAQARAEARAIEERKRRRLMGALAATVVLLLVVGGGGAWWLDQRRAEAEQNVTAELRQAMQLQAQGRLSEALASVRKAESLLPASGSATLRQEASERRIDLEFLTNLEEIRLHKAEMNDDRFDERGAARLYAGVFRSAGIDVRTQDVATAAERIRGRAIRLEMIAALADWAEFAGDMNEKAKVSEVLHAAAPEEAALLDRWYAAAHKHAEEISKLAALPAVQALPPAMLSHLGYVLEPAAATEFLKDALRRYPNDFWLNASLAFRLHFADTPDFVEAARYYTAALVLRPKAPALHLNLGAVLDDQGRFEEAMAEYRQAIACKADYAMAHYNLAVGLSRAGKVADAIAEYQTAVALNPLNADAWHNLGADLEIQGRLDEALAAYHKALAADPKHAITLNRLGLIVERDGKMKEAIAYYRQAVEQQPSTEIYRVNLQKALLRQERLEEAARLEAQMAASGAESAEICNNIGLELTKAGRLDAAMSYYRKAIALKPSLPEPHDNLGWVLSEKGHLPEAEKEFREAIRCQPAFPHAHTHLGAVLNRQNRFDEAEVEIRKAIELNPDSANAYTSLGIVLERRDKNDESIAAFRKALALAPDHFAALSNIAVPLEHLQRLDEAVFYLQKAVALDPQHFVSQYHLGRLLVTQNKHELALAPLQKALALKPNDADVSFYLGHVYSKQSKREEAAAAFRKVTATNPNFGAAHFHLANQFLALGRPAEAEAACRQAIALKFDDSNCYYCLGLALERQNRMADAEAVYRTAIGRPPECAEAYCNLGKLLQDRGEFADSLVMYRKGDELGRMRRDWRYASADWVLIVESMAAKEAKLFAVLRGESQPADNAERLALAQFAQDRKQFNAGAAKLYGDAFQADADLAADLSAGLRFRAACAAAAAGSGQGRDVEKLDIQEQARLRRRALEWLQAELTFWNRLPEKLSPADRTMLQKRLSEARKAGDLSGVRDTDKLTKLPAGEQQEWQKFWSGVAALQATLNKSP
jgi:serine/threonine-protein kinase